MLLCVLTNALIAALICSGSSGQTATISARSEGSSEVSILACFWDLGVNWGVNCSFGVSQVFVLLGVTFLQRRSTEPKVAGSSPARRDQSLLPPGHVTTQNRPFCGQKHIFETPDSPANIVFS